MAEMVVIDAIADLLHWLRRHDLDADEVLDRVQVQFEADVEAFGPRGPEAERERPLRSPDRSRACQRVSSFAKKPRSGSSGVPTSRARSSRMLLCSQLVSGSITQA